MRKLLDIILPCDKFDDYVVRCESTISLHLDSEFFNLIFIVPSNSLFLFRENFPMHTTIVESRKGIYSAMNDGIKSSQSEYLYFIGKDDLIVKNYIRVFQYLKLHKPDVLFCDVFYEKNIKKSCYPNKILLLKSNICHQGIIYHKSIFSRFGHYSKYMNVQADHFLNIKILWSRDILSHYLKIPICIYSNSGYSTKNKDFNFNRLYPLILRKYVGFWAYILILIYRFIK